MKLEGNALHFMLWEEFGEVQGSKMPRSGMFDYPILYDESADMSGHVVLLGHRQRPSATAAIQGALCICLDEIAARSARELGLAVLYVIQQPSFQRVYNFVQMAFVRCERLDAQLHAYVDSYAGFQPLLDACAEAMNSPCALIDEQYRSICQSNELGEAPPAAPGQPTSAELLESEAIDLFMAFRGYRDMRASHKVFTMPGSSDLFMKNVFFNTRLVGTLVVRHTGSILSARYIRFLLNYLAGFVESMYARVGSFGLASSGAGRIRSALNRALSGDAAGIALLETLLEEEGHRHGSAYVVLRIERSFTNEGTEARDYLAHRFELSWPRAYCFVQGETLYMLADTGEGPAAVGRAFLQELVPIARDNLAKIGMSRPFSEMKDLLAALAQASMALEEGARSQAENWCYRFDDYALDWILECVAAREFSEYACHPAVAQLRRFDEAHDSHLLETLRTFIACRYNATDASQALFVARSTLLNRLERIHQMTGIDLDDPQERLYLALSLALTRASA